MPKMQRIREDLRVEDLVPGQILIFNRVGRGPDKLISRPTLLGQAVRIMEERYRAGWAQQWDSRSDIWLVSKYTPQEPDNEISGYLSTHYLLEHYRKANAIEQVYWEPRLKK